jgi:hypothetical protein
MSKKIIPYVFVVLAMVLMIGCVSKQDYDAVVKERDGLKTQVSSLQADLDKSNTLKSDVAAIQVRLAKEMKALTIYSTYLTAVTSVMTANITGISTTVNANANFDTVSLVSSAAKFMTDFGPAIADLGNAELSQLWTEFIQSSSRMDTKAAGDKMSALRDMLIKLVNEDIKALATALH